MKRTRFSETQIVAILKQGDAGIKVKDRYRNRKLSIRWVYPNVRPGSKD